MSMISAQNVANHHAQHTRLQPSANAVVGSAAEPKPEAATSPLPACVVDDAPAVRQPVAAEVQQTARRAAVGREEMLQRNLERALRPEVRETKAAAAPAHAPASSTTAAPVTVSTGIRSKGSAGDAIAATADRLKQAGVVTAAEHAELTNEKIGPQDVAIGHRALGRVQADTPEAMQLLLAIPKMNNDFLGLQTAAVNEALSKAR
jgi:hypothetical protein